MKYETLAVVTAKKADQLERTVLETQAVLEKVLERLERTEKRLDEFMGHYHAIPVEDN